MSRYQESSTNMSDPGCVVAALVELGFDAGVIEQHAEAQTLYDWHGRPRPQKAHVIIRRQNTGLPASNDVGFFKDPLTGRFQAIVSDYDQQKFNESWIGKLKQGYSTIRAIAQAKTKGYRLLGRETQTINGRETVKLRFAGR